MKSLIKHPVSRLARIIGATLLLGAISCVTFSGTVRAEDMDPFQMDTGVWKSFDRYKEEQKEKMLNAATGDLEKDIKSVEAAEDAAEKEAQEKAEAPPPETKPVEVAAKPVLAQPDRPINTPELPALTTRFTANVDSTVDDEVKLPPAEPSRMANVEPDPETQAAKHDWLNAGLVAEKHAKGEDEDAYTPIPVRLTMLPSFKAPVPQKKKAPATQLASVIAPPPSPPADKASCDAVDAYKKRELEAIQSDRQTLVALQAAISELGLNKELSFISTGNSKINTPGDNTVSAQIDAAAP